MGDEEFLLQKIFQHLFILNKMILQHTHTHAHTHTNIKNTPEGLKLEGLDTENNQRRLVPPNPEAPRVPVEPEW